MAKAPTKTATEETATPVDGDTGVDELSHEELSDIARELNAGRDPTAPAARDEAREAAEEEAARPARPGDKRDEISSRIAAKRRDEMIPNAGIGPKGDSSTDDGEADGDVSLVSEKLYYGDFGRKDTDITGQAIEPKASDKEEPADAADGQNEPGEPAVDLKSKVKLTVDGEEVEVTIEDLVRDAQKDRAADQRLRDAAAILREAQISVAGAPPATPDTTAAGTGPDASPTKTISEPGLDEIDFAAIAEAIQVGEVEDGAKALKDLLEQASRARKDDAAPIDPAAIVQQVTAQVADNNASNQAREQFAQNYPEIVENERLGRMSVDFAVEAMVDDFRKAGADDVMIEHARSHPRDAVEAHKRLRTSGLFPDLRSPHDIYDYAGRKTREFIEDLTGKKFGATPGQTTATAPGVQPSPPPRSQRVRAAQQSPAARQTVQQRPQASSRPLTASERIEKIKAARGQD